MKIYREITFDINFEVVSEDSFEYEGQVAQCGGSGGGGAAATEYPEYIETIHENWLRGYLDFDGRIDDANAFNRVLETYLESTTPYTDAARPSGAKAYDPDTYLTLSQDELDELDTFADGLSTTETLWETYIDAVIAKAAEAGTFPSPTFLSNLSSAISSALSAAASAIASAPITTLIAEYEAEALTRFKRTVGRFAAGMADVGAVQSSSFVIGLALLESEHGRSMDRYAAELKLKVFDEIVAPSIRAHLEAEMRTKGIRDQFVAMAVSTFIELLRTKADSLKTVAAFQTELSRISIVAKKEQNDMNIMLDVNEALWDIKGFQFAANLLAAPAGGTLNPGGAELTALQSTIGGAFSGASIGATAGGPYGAGIGAVAGGLLGYFNR